MTKTTIIISILLIALGIAAVVGTGSPTAIIPAVLGAITLVLGFLMAKENLRKVMAHIAVVLTLLGFLAAVGRLVPSLMAEEAPTTWQIISLGGMAALCLLHVILSVQSFIAARKAMK